uniref:LRAT domain-containing protein n=1 Tax=Sander lucioperca TaxID=283035 RepID=A0A8D0A5U1_SANLU
VGLPFNAKPGDLIEIDRGMYQHWALYIGGMEVVHLTTPSSSGFALMVLDSPIGKVKREKIWEVVSNDSFKVNNLLDYKHQPHESYIIVKEACSMVGLELPYSIFTKNCEHFVTDLRYGKPESRQVGILWLLYFCLQDCLKGQFTLKSKIHIFPLICSRAVIGP